MEGHGNSLMSLGKVGQDHSGLVLPTRVWCFPVSALVLPSLGELVTGSRLPFIQAIIQGVLLHFFMKSRGNVIPAAAWDNRSGGSESVTLGARWQSLMLLLFG